jgi:hypothetical protein
MNTFLARHESEVKGVLSGFDRVRFRGTLRLIANSRGLSRWLAYQRVPYKSFTAYAKGLTDTIKEATQRLVEKTGRPLRYLPSSSIRKEDVAREIAEREGITEGLVCVLTAVEPCKTFSVGPNREKKLLELRSVTAKCLHQYFYLIDPQLGWLNVRVQTWLPFTVHVVINGREWLSRDLQRHGIAYEQRDNCFVARIQRRQLLSRVGRCFPGSAADGPPAQGSGRRRHAAHPGPGHRLPLPTHQSGRPLRPRPQPPRR